MCLCVQVLETTLLADQLRRQSDAIRLQTQASAASSPALAEGVAAAIERYNAIDASVKGTENQFIRLSAKQLKEADKEMKAIADEHGPHFHKMREAYESQSRSAREMTHLTTRLKVEWEVAYGWLLDMGFIEWREGMHATTRSLCSQTGRHAPRVPHVTHTHPYIIYVCMYVYLCI